MSAESLYSRRSNLIIAFHGCDQSLVDRVITGKDELRASDNDYDWLGHGIYFWENNEARALQWAQELSKRPNSSITKPAVIGAVIDLGYCFDLTVSFYLSELKTGYNVLEKATKEVGLPLPKNENIGSSTDRLLRKLDCAVIQTVHQLHEDDAHLRPYDSVRGVFWEGHEIYPNAGFSEKNHIQICVCNPNCIKGYFLPRKLNSTYSNP